MTVDPNIIIGGFVSVIVAIFGSAGFWQWVSNQGNKEVKAEIKKIRLEFGELKEADELKEARSARRRILRTNDEIYNHVKHSREFFDDVLEDINAYENFCRRNPDFRNGKAALAIENIERVYRECMKDGSFL
jgi:hypothetical protein